MTVTNISNLRNTGVGTSTSDGVNEALRNGLRADLANQRGVPTSNPDVLLASASTDAAQLRAQLRNYQGFRPSADQAEAGLEWADPKVSAWGRGSDGKISANEVQRAYERSRDWAQSYADAGQDPSAIRELTSTLGWMSNNYGRRLGHRGRGRSGRGERAHPLCVPKA